LLQCIRPVVCRFSDAGNEILFVIDVDDRADRTAICVNIPVRTLAEFEALADFYKRFPDAARIKVDFRLRIGVMA
jgi:hypothetical protein